MKRSKTIFRHTAVVLLAFGALRAQTLKPLADAGDSFTESAKTPSDTVVSLETLQPFTHETHILAASDLKSIHFEGIKHVHVATQVKLTLDPLICKNQTPDPGGSAYCPMAEPVRYEPAYQVTYSYSGPPLASDEYAGRRFTFSVFFRPGELDGSAPGSFARNKKVAAESLEVNTSREIRTGFVIDEKASSFCPGNYYDAEWKYDDPDCHDKLVLRKVTIPSDYVTVHIDAPQGR